MPAKDWHHNIFAIDVVRSGFPERNDCLKNVSGHAARKAIAGVVNGAPECKRRRGWNNHPRERRKCKSRAACWGFDIPVGKRCRRDAGSDYRQPLFRKKRAIQKEMGKRKAWPMDKIERIGNPAHKLQGTEAQDASAQSRFIPSRAMSIAAPRHGKSAFNPGNGVALSRAVAA